MSKETSLALSRDYQPGTVLFEEKDPGSRMYVIRSGRVKIYRKSGTREIVLAFLGPGEFFGEMALLENLPRSASAMVVEPSTLIEVDIDTFEEMIRRNIEVAVRIMRKLAARVRELDRRVEKLLIDNALGRTVEVLRWLLPQGLIEGDWIRVKGAAAHLDIGAQAGVPEEQVSDLTRRLQEAGCMRFDGGDLLIAHHETLDAFGSYLDLKRRYEPLSESLTAHKPAPEQALKRLLKALSMSHDQIEDRRSKLASDYQRYLDLHERFRALDD